MWKAQLSLPMKPNTFTIEPLYSDHLQSVLSNAGNWLDLKAEFRANQKF